MTEDEVGHNLLFFGLDRWTRASDKDRSDWIFDINLDATHYTITVLVSQCPEQSFPILFARLHHC